MAILKITQVKSRIGATALQCKNLDALGLKKIGRSVEHTDSAIIKGMVEKVKHLVKVETVEVAAPAAPKAEQVVEVAAVAAVAAEEAPKAKKTVAKKPATAKPAAKKTSKTTKKEE